MQPEHEQFLLDHVKKMGFIFIIDRLKSQFPNLTHEEACAINQEFKIKHSEDEVVKESSKQLKDMGKKIGGELEKQIGKILELEKQIGKILRDRG